MGRIYQSIPVVKVYAGGKGDMLTNKEQTLPIAESKSQPNFDEVRAPALKKEGDIASQEIDEIRRLLKDGGPEGLKEREPGLKNGDSLSNGGKDWRKPLDEIRNALPETNKADQIRYMLGKAREALIDGGGVVNGTIGNLMGGNRNANPEAIRSEVQGALNDRGLQQFSRGDLNSIASQFNRQCSNIYVPPAEAMLGAANFPGGYPKAFVDRENNRDYIKVVYTTTPNGSQPVRWQRNY